MRIVSTVSTLTLSALCLGGMNSAFADGSEGLGAPAIAVESGSGVIAAGIGLYTQPGVIQFAVPNGAAVKQVWLYWDGAHHLGATPDSTLVVNGVEVAGTTIGGPTTFGIDPFNPPLGPVLYTAFRADVTGRGFVSPGANLLTVEGLDNTFANDGAGVLVVYQEGSATSEIMVRDGLDLAWWNSSGDLQVTEPETFVFEPAQIARTASLSLFVGSVDQNRPNQIRLTVAGQETVLVDLLFSNTGDQWDALTLPVVISAGADSLTVELVSTPIDNALGGGASLAWVTAALSLPVVLPEPEPVPTNPGVRTPGYWKNHAGAWPVEQLQLGAETYAKADAIAIMNRPTAGDKTLNLAEHLIAAKLNVAAGNDASCISAAIEDADAFLALHPVGSGVAANSSAWKSIESTFETVVDYNEGRLCVSKTEENSQPSPSSGRAFTRLEKNGQKIKLDWKGGKLEWAEDLNGPWTPFDGPASSSEFWTTGKTKFFRIQ
ncbi:MAG: hypothetical protein AB9869_05840 [Verrucomicrobiia bacterium]